MVDWLNYWNKKADEIEFNSMDRSAYSLRELFIYIDSIKKAVGEFKDNDIILDIGSGVGYTTVVFHSFVKKIYLADFSIKMVQRAKSEMSYFGNMVIYQDSLPDMKNTKEKRIKFSKIIVGSVIQYLKNYNEVKYAFSNLHSIMEPEGILLVTHTPDITKKKSFLKTFQRLEWPEDKIKSAIHYENAIRFWFDFNKLLELAKKAGFSKCEKQIIPNELFQSKSMFDMVLRK